MGDGADSRDETWRRTPASWMFQIETLFPIETLFRIETGIRDARLDEIDFLESIVRTNRSSPAGPRSG